MTIDGVLACFWCILDRTFLDTIQNLLEFLLCMKSFFCSQVRLALAQCWWFDGLSAWGTGGCGVEDFSSFRVLFVFSVYMRS
ncbi:hypothetical protein BDY21DRAFT_345512 [Lineolata rhizophorae]|uniref:Uncharacterized protein n=1 Tax=Lineolata rhizophorae TaxID=578093 RepID=A0A6A6P0H0_9PEZI|nr:hypothetical protein BDY21DRAFT_345512 [Lineolata rhizophorae]